MANLYFDRNDSTPLVAFKENGELLIEGRSLAEDPKLFYIILFEWVKKLKTEKVNFISKIEYMNTASTKMFLELLKEIESNKNVKTFDVEWHHEADDPDMIELGELFEEDLENANFSYCECVEFGV